MAIQELISEDIWFMFDGKSQLENIGLLYDYTIKHDMIIDYRDQFPRQIVKGSRTYYYRNQIYKYDIKTNIAHLDCENMGTDYGCAQFISDEERIILRPFYPSEKESISQRKIILDDFVIFLYEIKMKFKSN